MIWGYPYFRKPPYYIIIPILQLHQMTNVKLRWIAVSCPGQLRCDGLQSHARPSAAGATKRASSATSGGALTQSWAENWELRDTEALFLQNPFFFNFQFDFDDLRIMFALKKLHDAPRERKLHSSGGDTRYGFLCWWKTKHIPFHPMTQKERYRDFVSYKCVYQH